MKAEDEVWVCTRCGTRAQPEYYRGGSITLTMVLLFLFVLPGLFYYLWWNAKSYWGCRECGSGDLIPSDSPRAQLVITG